MGQQQSSASASNSSGSLLGRLASLWGSAGAKEKLSPEEIAKLRERRAHIAKEILQTEETYLKALEEAHLRWEQPLRESAASSKPIIAAAQVKSIFSTIEVIYGVHKKLCAALRGKINFWDDKQLIGDIFIENAPILKLYTEYVNNYDHAMDTLAVCVKSKPFVHFLQATSGKPTTMALVSLLIQPVQRLPRYEMLLTDLIKHTWESHPDIQPLRMALVKIKETADFVNESKRRSENRARLLDIQRLIGDKYDLFHPARQILSESEVLIVDGKKTTPAHCTEITDTLLLWVDKGSAGKVKLCALYEDFCSARMPIQSGDLCLDVVEITHGKNIVHVTLSPDSKETVGEFAARLEQRRKACVGQANRIATPGLSPAHTPNKHTPAGTPERRLSSASPKDRDDKEKKRDDRDKKGKESKFTKDKDHAAKDTPPEKKSSGVFGLFRASTEPTKDDKESPHSPKGKSDKESSHSSKGSPKESPRSEKKKGKLKNIEIKMNFKGKSKD